MKATTDKLTQYAQKVSENGMVFAYLFDGIYYLAVRYSDKSDHYRNLTGLGLVGHGIRYLKQQIDEYFKDK